jgi:hypothetical protein
MSDWTVSDPMGSILYELRVANVASKRVRAAEPAPGDAQPHGSYQRFVVVVDLGGPRQHRMPLQVLRYAIRAYGVTYQDARDLYGECSDVLDNAGPRYGPTDVALYQTLDDTGGSASKDPDTGQPVYEGIFEIFAGAQALAS